MKKLVREYEFSPEQLHTVKRLAAELKISETTASILYARGMDTAEKMRIFLNPSKEHFLSPFLMQGMYEAVSLISRAKEEEWSVVVFGDYDADGIGALAIMDRALKRYGITPHLYVPERREGYGMSIAALDKLFDEYLPDLIITVDCGISCRNEVEYIKEQGAYCIVTDHHELPETLPDCIVINPKLKDDYPYDNLCGAGVAFKLASALLGERAYDLLDFCALSTVADSVPLTCENRDIVAEGLKLIEENPRPCFAALLGKNGEVTAQTLAFTVAPRVNAAGRMGDAYSALRLFTTENEEEVYLLAEKLNIYNTERQKCCDELYGQASAQISREGAFDNIVMLAAENWNAGFLGIVAARIAEEYNRPALLFVRRGDSLKGSARSIENVNIFGALRDCSAWIEEFGGHAQAAGINVQAEKFPALKQALDEYIGSHSTREDFQPVVVVCDETDAPDSRLAREICALEPFGMGNRRPLFATRAGALNAYPIKEGSPHLTISGGELEFMYFGGADEVGLLRSNLNKTLIFEYNLSRFRGKEYLKGFVRTVLYGSDGDIALEAFENVVRGLKEPSVSAEEESLETLNALIAERRAACAYGLCCVFSDPATPARYGALAGMETEVFRPSSASDNVLLYAPEPGCDLTAYREVVFLDRPASRAVRTGRARVFENHALCGYGKLCGLHVTREVLLEVFSSLRANAALVMGDSYAEAARSCNALGFSGELFVFALAVFEELELISLKGGRLTVYRGKKTELTSSRIYTECQRLASAD